MRRLLAALLLLAAAVPARAQWTCHVADGIDARLRASMWMQVADGGGREPPGFEIHVRGEDGHGALQRMTWVGIPLDATILWKPDDIYFGIGTERTDEEGTLLFVQPPYGQRHGFSARGMVRSLGPDFPLTPVTVESGSLVQLLWRYGPWTVEYRDRNREMLGTATILLPRAEAAQALFTRMRAELERKASDPARNCEPIPEPTQQELEDSVSPRGTRIPRPDVSSVAPVTDSDRPPAPPPR